MKSFHFVACFIGECCARPHLWSQSARAHTREEAWKKVKEDIERSGLDISEAIEIDSPNVNWMGQEEIAS